MICSKHNDPLKVYCVTCNEVICRDCTFAQEHKTHNFELITECYSKHHQQIKTNLKLVKQKLANTDTAVTGLVNRVIEVDRQGGEVKKEIRLQAQQLIDRILRSEGELTQQVDGIVDKKKELLSKQKEEAGKIRRQLKSCETKIEQNLKELSQQKFLMEKQAMMREIKINSENVHPAVFQPIEKANIQFSKGASEINNGIGKVKSDRYEKVVVRSSSCFLDEQSTVTISLQSHDGSPFTLPPSLISSTITSPDCYQPLTCNIYATECEAQYAINFIPCGRKTHQLMVKVGGIEMSTSPISIKERQQDVRNRFRGGSTRFKANQSSLDIPTNNHFVSYGSRGDLGPSNGVGGIRQRSQTELITHAGRQGIQFDTEPEDRLIYSPTCTRKPLRTIRLYNSHGQMAIHENGDILAIGQNSVTKLDRAGIVLRTIGREGTHPGSFMNPCGIAIYDQAHFLVTDQHRLLMLTVSGNRCSSVGSRNSSHMQTQFNNPAQMLTVSGNCCSSFGSRNSSHMQTQFNNPAGIAVHPISKKIYVADQYNNRIQGFEVDHYESNTVYSHSNYGEYLLKMPIDVAVDRNGFLFVVEYSAHCIKKLTTTGQYIKVFGSIGSAPGQLYEPVSLAVNKNLVFVCEKGNNRVSVFDTNGKFLDCFGEEGSGEGQFNKPVCVRTLQNELYVSDYGNKRIVVFDKDNNY